MTKKLPIGDSKELPDGAAINAGKLVHTSSARIQLELRTGALHAVYGYIVNNVVRRESLEKCS
jgi:hypothetical protein